MRSSVISRLTVPDIWSLSGGALMFQIQESVNTLEHTHQTMPKPVAFFLQPKTVGKHVVKEGQQIWRKHVQRQKRVPCTVVWTDIKHQEIVAVVLHRSVKSADGHAKWCFHQSFSHQFKWGQMCKSFVQNINKWFPVLKDWPLMWYPVLNKDWILSQKL